LTFTPLPYALTIAGKSGKSSLSQDAGSAIGWRNTGWTGDRFRRGFGRSRGQSRHEGSSGDRAPGALPSASRYRSGGNADGGASHLGGTGFVTQGWNSGLDSRAQGATNMTMQYGVFGTAMTVGTGG
jgi:hypothetical protein